MRRHLLLALMLLAAPMRAVEPTPAGPVLASLVAHMLQRGHYEKRPLDVAMSRKFLENLLDSYDYNRMYFTKADVDGFTAEYGDTIGERAKAGEVGAAYAVYDRFMARLTERRALVSELVASSMTFTAHESVPTERHKEPWAASDAEMRERWRLGIKFELLRVKLDGEKGEDPLKAVLAHYDSVVENYKQFDSGDVLQNYLSALCRVYDPHTDYFAAAKEENFTIGMRLSLFGIGAQLRTEKGYTSVVGLVPGGPAETDKRLKPGDKIVAVAQGDDGEFADVVGMKIDRVVKLIRGEKGSVVRLRVLPGDAADASTRVVVRLVRDEIRLRDQEAKARLMSVRGPGGAARKFGVIDLPSFYADLKAQGQGKSTTRDVATLLDSLLDKGAQGLVLDLRRNGGGSLQEALALTGLFIGDGPVVQVKDNAGSVTVLESGTPRPVYEGPLVVLTSRFSASASEIVAAAFQDYGRAAVVGSKSTFGKGTVQTVMDLERYMPPSLRDYKPGAVHLTVQKFYRVSGGSTQNRGAVPDVLLPSVEDEMDIAESSLPNALPYDRITPARFTPVHKVGRLLPSLIRASHERVAASPEWAYAREDIERYRKEKEDKTVSLNEEERRAERAADEARDKKRRKERLERAAGKPEPEKPLEITLEHLDGVVPSTAAVTAPVKPDPVGEAGKDDAKKAEDEYSKAPPAPDLMLDEALAVLADVAAQTAPRPALVR